MKERLLYPDICKFFAIFLVTWSHCAQCVSGEIWTNFLAGTQLDIGFNMPLFMLISGWFINLDKMRNSNIMKFVFSKFKRLIIPSFVWYFIYSAFSLSRPDTSIFTYYWYLNALFICLCVIMMFAKVVKNNVLCCLISTTFILTLPYSDFSHVNYMFPFLWAGLGLRKLLNTEFSKLFVILCSLIGFGLCLIWNNGVALRCPSLNSLFIDKQILYAYIYRFVIGFTISTVIIFVIMKAEQKLRMFAPLGTYSLVVYTASLAIIGALKILFNHFNIHTNEYICIDIISLCLCILIVCCTIFFCNCCRKHRITSILFLGE